MEIKMGMFTEDPKDYLENVEHLNRKILELEIKLINLTYENSNLKEEIMHLSNIIKWRNIEIDDKSVLSGGKVTCGMEEK